MNILIAGVSKGLGLAITRECLMQGHTVYGISRQSSPELQMADDMFPGQFYHIPFDLENIHQIKDVIKSQISAPIHGFINNAAIAYDTLVTNIDTDKLIEMTNINQIAPMILTKYVIRNMILHSNPGSIVHISSISAHTGYKGLAMYAATKGALEAFSKGTAREWGGKGIRSNCVASGFLKTDMTSSLDEEKLSKIAKRSSLQDLTSIHSVVKSVMFLLSDDAKSITGQVMHVDSGAI